MWLRSAYKQIAVALRKVSNKLEYLMRRACKNILHSSVANENKQTEELLKNMSSMAWITK